MKFSKHLTKKANEGYLKDQQALDDLLLKLELKRVRKSISIKEATKNRP